MTRIVADVTRCLGAGQCVLTDPDTFDQTEDGTVVLLRDEVDGAALAAAGGSGSALPGRCADPPPRRRALNRAGHTG